MKLSEQDLQVKIDELPQEMSPERDLWIGIEKAIQHKTQESANRRGKNIIVPVAWAASVCLAVLMTWGSMTPTEDSMQTLSVASVLKEDFAQQRQTLLVSFGAPDISKLSPEMQAELNKLASARKSIEKALTDDPENADLLNLLRWTQQQELDFIEKLYSPQWQSI